MILRTTCALVALAAMAWLALWARPEGTRHHTRASATVSEPPVSVVEAFVGPTGSPLERPEADHVGSAGVGGGEEVVTAEIDPVDLLQGIWAREKRSGNWQTFETAMSELLEHPDLKDSRLVSVECRATLCRTEVRVPSKRVVNTIASLASRDDRLSAGEGRYRIEGDSLVIFTGPGGLPPGTPRPLAL